GNRLDDLAVEIEAQVVAGREVGEPLLADADHAAVDLVDDGIDHRVRVLQAREVLGRLQPAPEPTALVPRRGGRVEDVGGDTRAQRRGPELRYVAAGGRRSERMS